MLFLQAWYNTKGYHAAPTFLNVLNNIILRSKAAEKGLNASRFGKIRGRISFYVTGFHCCVTLFLFLPLVVEKVDNAIHWIVKLVSLILIQWNPVNEVVALTWSSK